MLGVIPFLNAGTYSFDTFYRRSLSEISEAAGEHILFDRIGNPKFSDRLYKAMRTPDITKEDRRLQREWERKYSTTEAEERQRIDESLTWQRTFGVESKDLPCLVFVTQPAQKIGLLRIARHWFDRESSWEVFLRCFCSWLGQKHVVTLATADLDDAAVSRRLSRSLRKLTLKVNERLQSKGATQRDTADERVQPIYCMVISEKGKESLTRSEYEQRAAKKDTLDILIDGTTLEVRCRDAQGTVHDSSIRPGELAMLSEYMEFPGKWIRPRDTNAGKECNSLDAANRMFYAARRAVGPATEESTDRFFKRDKSAKGTKNRRFRFDPHSTLKYLVSLPT